MAKILISGFDPFGGRKENPSATLATLLSKLHKDLSAIILPTSYSQAGAKLIAAATAMTPNICLLFGVGSTSHALKLEMFARNLDVAKSRDNDEVRRRGPISLDAPARLQTGVDVERLFRTLSDEGHDVVLSRSAGGYVCNHVYFEILAHIFKSDCQALFVHVPGPLLEDRSIRAAERLLQLL